MQKAAAIWTLKTQEVCKLPQSTTAKIMEDVGSLYESALVNIHAHVSSLLNESGISLETIPHLSAIFSPDSVHEAFLGVLRPIQGSCYTINLISICGK